MKSKSKFIITSLGFFYLISSAIFAMEERIEDNDTYSQLIADRLQKQNDNFKNLLKGSTEYEQMSNPSDDTYQKSIDTITDGLNGAAAIATLFNKPKDALAIVTYGSAAIQSVNAIKTLVTSGLTAGINPYLGLLTAAASITTLFQKDPLKAHTKAILNAIVEGVTFLSEQMYEFHKDVREHFEGLYNALNTHHQIMLEQFFALHQNQATIIEKLEALSQYVIDNHKEIQGNLDLLHQQAQSHFAIMLDNLNGLRVEEIDDLKAKILLEIQPSISEKKFIRYMNKLFVKAKERASADSLTGGSVPLDTGCKETVQALLQSSDHNNIFAHPAFFNINFLSRYLENKFPNFKHKKLVNPLIWIKCVEAILHATNHKFEHDIHYPSTADISEREIQNLLKLKEEGEKVLAFIKIAHENAAIEKLSLLYHQNLMHLIEAFLHEQKEFETELTQELRKELCAFIDDEKTKTRNAEDSCEHTCIGFMNQALDMVDDLKPCAFWKDNRINSLPSYDEAEKFPECSKRAYQNYLKEQEAKNIALINATNINLTQENITPLGNGMSAYVYPSPECPSAPTLLLPREALPLNSLYITAENNGLGFITHTYNYGDTTFMFDSDFTFKFNNRKIKILRLTAKLDQQNLYCSNENVIHSWEGGYYPKEVDIIRNIFEKMALANGKGPLKRIFDGYYPMMPYQGLRNTIISQGCKEEDDSDANLGYVQEQLQKVKEERRLRFNNHIASQLLSRTSTLYKATLDVDYSYKMLEGILTVMYNERCNQTDNGLGYETNTNFYPAWTTFKSNKFPTIKNMATLQQYVNHYPNSEVQQPDYVPCHIYRTAERFMNILSILSSHPPQFSAVHTIIQSLDRLIHRYKTRTIIPKLSIAMSLQDSGVFELMRSQHQQLSANNNKLTQEMDSVKQELQETKKQLAVITSLLLEIKNNGK